MAFVVDEIVPVSCGGDPLDFENTQPAHWMCNARRGNKPMMQSTGADTPTKNLPLPQPWDD